METIDLAHGLGMKTVAEGVETSETADAVTQLGCDQLQGWLFAKVLPLDEIIEQYNLANRASVKVF